MIFFNNYIFLPRIPVFKTSETGNRHLYYKQIYLLFSLLFNQSLLLWQQTKECPFIIELNTFFKVANQQYRNELSHLGYFIIFKVRDILYVSFRTCPQYTITICFTILQIATQL